MKHFVAVALVALIANTAQARSWRINNDTTKNPDFADINAAMNSGDVVAGDTLYLDPGCSLTTEQTVSKQVTVIGCGYFRADAPHDMASVTNKVWITGAFAKMESIIFGSDVNIDANNVVLERCKVSGVISIAPTYSGTYPSAQNATIRQCYGTRVVGCGRNDMRSVKCTIENSIFMANDYNGVIYNLYSPIIRHCYLRQASNNNNVTNSNIFEEIGHATVTDCIYLNVAYGNQIWYNSDADLNQNNISSSVDGNTEANIFTLEGADDRRYQLKDDSPAKGAASDGGDCGPFGGQYPYVIGGLPGGHPYYTKATISPRSNNDKVKVSLQIKMQDE